jgi:hypothetical protein
MPTANDTNSRKLNKSLHRIVSRVTRRERKQFDVGRRIMTSCNNANTWCCRPADGGGGRWHRPVRHAVGSSPPGGHQPNSRTRCERMQTKSRFFRRHYNNRKHATIVEVIALVRAADRRRATKMASSVRPNQSLKPNAAEID